MRAPYVPKGEQKSQIDYEFEYCTSEGRYSADFLKNVISEENLKVITDSNTQIRSRFGTFALLLEHTELASFQLLEPL